MSYNNGIGVPQQLPGMAEASASSSTGRATKTESASLSVPAQNDAVGSSPIDDANLSFASNMVGQALAGNDVRTDKVAALQQSITAGTYNVSSSDVAAKVLNALLQ